MHILNVDGDTNGFAPAAKAALSIGPSDGSVQLGGITYQIDEVELHDAQTSPTHKFEM